MVYTGCTCLMLLLFIMVNAYIDRWTNLIFIIAIVAILLLLFVSCEEQSLKSYRHMEFSRVMFTAAGYSIKPFISYLVFLSLVRGEKLKCLLYGIPALFNIALNLISMKNGIVFDFSPDNSFIRGEYNILPFIVTGFYLVLTLVYSIRLYSNQRKWEIAIVSLIAFQLAALIILESYFSIHNLVLYILPVSLLFYYMYLYTLNFKLDYLTGAYTRACLELDVCKIKRKSRTGIIIADIDGLKSINDSFGHIEGDSVIHAVGTCIKRTLPKYAQLYRAGGDEFLILLRHSSLLKLKELSHNIKSEVKAIGYSVSVGYALYDYSYERIRDAVEEADRVMYNDKSDRIHSNGSENAGDISNQL